MKIRKSVIPPDSKVSKYFPANYSDTYSCEVISETTITPDDVMIAFWTKPPNWVDCLFSLRNKMVKLIGIKVTESNKDRLIDCIKNGKQYDIFSLVYKSEKESILKLSDKHLDAYISVYIEKSEKNTHSTSVTTVVHIHNRIGYIYFYSICPFHKIVVKGMMSNVFD